MDMDTINGFISFDVMLHQLSKIVLCCCAPIDTQGCEFGRWVLRMSSTGLSEEAIEEVG
jgi:hypothetical protein